MALRRVFVEFSNNTIKSKLLLSLTFIFFFWWTFAGRVAVHVHNSMGCAVLSALRRRTVIMGFPLSFAASVIKIWCLFIFKRRWKCIKYSFHPLINVIPGLGLQL
ncbi:hypothetical protein BX600DRAFT_458969 [Xylariales sp. PMI_506]|nr:hypothetical protein BX600DRAFT_458969 [Xylariales sp. PMI_506]